MKKSILFLFVISLILLAGSVAKADIFEEIGENTDQILVEPDERIKRYS